MGSEMCIRDSNNYALQKVANFVTSSEDFSPTFSESTIVNSILTLSRKLLLGKKGNLFKIDFILKAWASSDPYVLRLILQCGSLGLSQFRNIVYPEIKATTFFTVLKPFRPNSFHFRITKCN